MNFSLDSHKLHHHLDRVCEFKNTGDCVPIYMEVSPCGSCNHRCIFCAYDYIAYPNRKLDLDKFKSFTADISKRGLKSMLFAGEGEPLMHPKISEFIAFAKSCSLDIGMFSNGALLSSNLSKSILPNLTFLRFSLNAGNAQNYKDIHNSNKAKSDFETVVKNIEFASKFKKDQNLKVDLGSQFVLIEENKTSLIDAVVTMKKCGLDYISIKPFVLQNDSQFYKTKSIDQSDVNSLVDEALALGDDKFKVIFRKNAFENSSKFGEKSYKHCYGCSFITALNSAGDLATCLPYWDQGKFVYGNIYEQSFDEIWGGGRRKVIKEFLETKLNTKKCPPNCRPNAINEFLYEILDSDIKHINFI